MTKEQFQKERTRIISEMLDNPDEYGIYPTSKCYQALDELFEKLTSTNTGSPKLPSRERAFHAGHIAALMGCSVDKAWKEWQLRASA